MAGSSSLTPAGSGPLRRPEGGQVARPFAGRAPTHQAGSMGMTGGKPLRQECWDAMGPLVRERLQQRAGTIIEWWATADSSLDEDRPEATVFGDQGLCIAEPRLNTEHRPVYALSRYVLDPASLRNVSIDHRPASGPQPRRAGSSRGPAGPAGPDIGLTAPAKGILGNLPPEAQELLQAPFLTGQNVLRCDWHYEGQVHRLSMFMFYIAGPKDICVAAGTKMVPAGHTDETAHWSLRVHRASVVRRIGT